MATWRPPKSAQSVAIRPLDKGMFLNRAGMQVPVGGFRDIEGYIVDPQGLRRRPGFFTTGDGNTFSSTARAVDMFHRYLLDGNRYEYLITNEFLYLFDYTSDYTIIPFKYTTGTVTTADGDTISGTSTVWTTTTDIPNVKAGDYFKLTSDAESRLTKIASVTNATTIVLDSTYHNTSFTDEDYEIYRVFGNEDDQELIGKVITADRAVILSPNLPPVEINSSNNALDELQDSTPADAKLATKYFTAKVGQFFNERLWLGHIYEWDGSSTFEDNRQRLRYSTATNLGNLEDDNYIDLTYTGGSVKSIKPLGNTLAVYFDDSLYLGYPTSQYGLPLVFDAMETGGRGLTGMRAIVPFQQGHFAVFQDNIYYITQNNIEAIGDRIIRDSLRKCEHQWRIQACLDPRRSRVVFGFPLDQEYIQTVYSFNYQTNAWSHEDYDTWMLANPRVDRALSWDGLSTLSLTWDTLDTLSTSWDDLSSPIITDDLIREYTYYLQVAGNEVSEDSVAGDINAVIESGDLDFDRPEDLKVFTRLAAKIEFLDDTELSEDLEFTVEVSHNRGRQWKTVGTLTIDAGDDEGYVNFRLTSSHMRFRLTSTSEVPQYVVAEITLRVAIRGKEGSLSLQGDR